MGNMNSADDPYGYGYGYNGYNVYNNELERYYRRYYPQYNSYYTPQPYAQPNYYGYQQQLIPNMTAGYASSPYAATYGSYGMPGYSYNSPIYSSMYNSAPVYGQTYNNGYYPANYLQRTYL